MEYNKSKWELKYDTFKKSNYEQEIDSIKRKIKEEAQKFNEAIQNGKNNDAQKAQDEINKLQVDIKKKETSNSAIKANEAKIENILQLKKDLVKESGELARKQAKIKNYKTLEKYIADKDVELKNHEKEIEQIDNDIKALNKKINDPQVDPKDKKTFEEEKRSLNNKRKEKTVLISQSNDDKYSDACKAKAILEREIATYDEKSIEKILAKNEKLIAKCDLIGKNLMNGKSMEDINVSLKQFKFTPNKDFAKKVSAMRDIYLKEENDNKNVAKQGEEKAVEEAQKAYEKATSAIEQAKKAEEEYRKLTNLPAQQTPWYKKAPIIKHMINAFEKITHKGEKQAQKIEEARAKAEQARKEVEVAKKEFFEKNVEAEKVKVETGKIEKGRSIDYLSELRKQKGENTILEGMTLYGDTFKDRLKYQMPNIKTSLTQDEIDQAKSKNNYVLTNQKGKNDHSKDKRAYDVEARKAMIKKNIEDIKKMKTEKQARQDGNERD